MSPVDRQSPASDDSLAQVLEHNHPTFGDLTGSTVGDFRVERLLGRGGMGEVYLATQISLNRPVALKVLRADVLSKPGYRDRFTAEALAVAKLNHPSIVHVYAMGQIEGVHFIAMEYVEGINLREYVVKRGALDLAQALSIMKQTAQAIGAAGEAGIIHRDVKPENILITRRGRVKVADFGLCRQLDEDAPQLTQTGITMGTPAYMSPEQAQGHSLDHRSDLYSLGASFYFMLAAVSPFKADSPVAMALKQVREIPSSLLIHRPDLPLEVDRLVMKLMAKNPADRYQSAAEMLGDLARIRETVPPTGGGATGVTDTFDGMAARTGEIATFGSFSAPVPRVGERRSPAEARPSPAAPPVGSAEDAGIPAVGPRFAVPRFSGLVAAAAVAIGLCTGGAIGWAGRAPDALSLPEDASQGSPGLWIEPRSSVITKQDNAEAQLRYALLHASRDDWAAAWLAVPKYHPRSHDAGSRAYVQLARLWYRRGDVEALSALAAELGAWKQGQKRDKDLATLILVALELKRGDLGAVEQAFARMTDADVADVYEASLASWNVEVCADAIRAVQKSGNQTLEEPLRRALRRLVWHLYRIEMGGPGGAAARGGGGGAATAPRPGG